MDGVSRKESLSKNASLENKGHKLNENLSPVPSTHVKRQAYIPSSGEGESESLAWQAPNLIRDPISKTNVEKRR